MKVLRETQYELALLWKTMEIVKDFEDNSITNLFEDLSRKVQSMPDLGLSAYWPLKLKVDGKAQASTTEESDILNIRTLSYLKNESKLNMKHDPLDLINRLYRTAADSLFDLKFQENDRIILVSACLILAIKSGRASLLLRAIKLLASCLDNSAKLNAALLKDIYQFVSNKLASTPLTSRESTDLWSDPLVVLGYKHTHNPQQSTRNALTTDEQYGSSEQRGGLILSFGKADHGECVLHSSSYTISPLVSTPNRQTRPRGPASAPPRAHDYRAA